MESLNRLRSRLPAQMVKYVSEDREYSRAIRESIIVQSDMQMFVELRGVVVYLRQSLTAGTDFFLSFGKMPCNIYNNVQ